MEPRKNEASKPKESSFVFLYIILQACSVLVYLPSQRMKWDRRICAHSKRKARSNSMYLCNINYYIFIIARLLNSLEKHHTGKSGNGIESAANKWNRSWRSNSEYVCVWEWERGRLRKLREMVNNKIMSTVKKRMMMTTTTITTPLNSNKTTTTTAPTATTTTIIIVVVIIMINAPSMESLLATKTRIFLRLLISFSVCFSHTLHLLSFFFNTRIIIIYVSNTTDSNICLLNAIDERVCIRIHGNRTWVLFPLKYCKPSLFSFLLTRKCGDCF